MGNLLTGTLGNVLTEGVGKVLTGTLGNVLTGLLGKVLDIYSRRMDPMAKLPQGIRSLHFPASPWRFKSGNQTAYDHCYWGCCHRDKLLGRDDAYPTSW